MKKEEQLKQRLANVQQEYDQLEVRDIREKQAIQTLRLQSRAYRKERAHRLIQLGAALEHDAGVTLSPEDVDEIYSAAVGNGGYKVSKDVPVHP